MLKAIVRYRCELCTIDFTKEFYLEATDITKAKEEAEKIVNKNQMAVHRCPHLFAKPNEYGVGYVVAVDIEDEDKEKSITNTKLRKVTQAHDDYIASYNSFVNVLNSLDSKELKKIKTDEVETVRRILSEQFNYGLLKELEKEFGAKH